MTFIDDILREAEEADAQRQIELDNLRADQTLMAIGKLEDQLAEVEELYSSELKILQEYREAETTRIGNKVRWLSWNLEQFMRGLDLKTLPLPHGVLKLRKGRDKVEVVDIESFFAGSGHERFVKAIPETFQPDLQALHEHIRLTGELPAGVNLISGDQKFSYTTIRKGNDNGPQRKQRTSETGTETERVSTGEAVERQAVRGE